MPHYHLSLITDQPIAIKTRICARGISSNSSSGSEANSGVETDLREAGVTVDELHALVQLLQTQMQILGKNVETVIKLYEDQGNKIVAPRISYGFWRRLGMLLGLVSRPQVSKDAETIGFGLSPTKKDSKI
jgi:hypothetical protein